MAVLDKRKQSIYLPEGLLDEMRAQADKYEVSLSRIVQDCFNIVKTNAKNMEWIPGTIAFSQELGRDRSRRQGDAR